DDARLCFTAQYRAAEPALPNEQDQRSLRPTRIRRGPLPHRTGRGFLIHEVPVALSTRARAILRDYVAAERAGAPPTAPLFVVTYVNKAGLSIERRITGQRIWKVVRAAGKRTGIPALHPHALRHACGAQLLRRTRNLRLVQEQLRHAEKHHEITVVA